jgi:FkbM family methyltransferase
VVFSRPEYLLQPAKLARRIFGPRSIPAESAQVRLPWGRNLNVRKGDVISEIIWQTGVYDLALSEVVWRLLDPGEPALDVGANIGYVSSLMSARNCRVTSFEPHPELFRELESNAASWPGVTVRRAGLADSAGQAYLDVPADFSRNRGTAKLGAAGLEITTETLDAHPAAFAKVDVEGLEAAVFRGGSDSLSSHRLRDIVFEDFGPFPTPAMRILLDHGYSLFRVEKRLWGPVLSPPERPSADPFSAPNFLATADPARARHRLLKPGWQVL